MKIGRPSLDPFEKRSVKKSLTFAEDEFQLVQDKAGADGAMLAVWMRKVILLAANPAKDRHQSTIKMHRIPDDVAHALGLLMQKISDLLSAMGSVEPAWDIRPQVQLILRAKQMAARVPILYSAEPERVPSGLADIILKISEKYKLLAGAIKDKRVANAQSEVEHWIWVLYLHVADLPYGYSEEPWPSLDDTQDI